LFLIGEEKKESIKGRSNKRKQNETATGRCQTEAWKSDLKFTSRREEESCKIKKKHLSIYPVGGKKMLDHGEED